MKPASANSCAWRRMVSLTPQISMMAMIAPAGVSVRDRQVGAHLAVAQLDPDVLRLHPGAFAAVFAAGSLSNDRALPANIMLRLPDVIGSASIALMVLRIRPRPCSASNGASVANRHDDVAEERMPAARGGEVAVERGVGVEHLVVVHRPLLQAGILGRRIALGRAEEDLAEAETDPAGEVRNHAAHVMGDDLEIRQLVEDASNRSAGSCRPSSRTASRS